MRKAIRAVVENGLLRPLEPLGLLERQQVSLNFDDEVEAATDDDVLDHEFLKSLEAEDLPEVPIEEVWAALAKIPGSMTSAFISEREERLIAGVLPRLQRYRENLSP